MAEELDALETAVQAWCTEHDATLVRVMQVPSIFAEDELLLGAEVRFANGKSFTAHAPKQATVLADLTRLGLIVRGAR